MALKKLFAEALPVEQKQVGVAKAPASKPEVVRKGAGRRWSLIIAAVPLGIVGLIGFWQFSQNMNMFLGVLGIMAMLGGGTCLWFGLQKNEGYIVKKNSPGSPGVQANTIIIRPNIVEFDYIEGLEGMEHPCDNNGKLYHMLIGTDGQLTDFTLPDQDQDQQFYDPQEFANPISMPANKRLFEFSPSKIKAISLVILAVIVAILGVVLIAMAGNGGT
jgi:hypothetical protein